MLQLQQRTLGRNRIMVRLLRTLVFTVLFALLGAVAGRVVAEQRSWIDNGNAMPPKMNILIASPRPQEIIPGLVAAIRVGNRPWSFLRISPWLAAFVVNFVITAMGAKLQPLAHENNRALRELDFDKPPASPSTSSAETVATHMRPDDKADTDVRIHKDGFTAFEH
jgi:hypothetical protein